MKFEDRLKEYALKIGFDLIGFTTAEPFADALGRLKKMAQLGYLSPWAEQDLEKRCHPKGLMADAKSIIAVAISYLPTEEVDQEEKERWESHQHQTPGNFRGRLARFAQFQDYHQLLRAKMVELVDFIQREYPEVKAEMYVDTGPLLDREVAYRAGLGFIGKNAALIHPEYGSFLALGEIILNLSLQSDQPLEDGCGDCNLCIESCPQQVIKGPGEIATRECLAHYTQEKGLLEPGVRRKLGQRLWGCDTCQDVCPFNRQARPGQSGLFREHALGKRPDLVQILGLSNREYQELVGGTAMAWRGKRTLQRNALINLGNARRPEAVPILEETLEDQRPVIRGISAWALGEIGGMRARNLLEQVLEEEKDPQVKEEIEKGLARVVKNNK